MDFTFKKPGDVPAVPPVAPVVPAPTVTTAETAQASQQGPEVTQPAPPVAATADPAVAGPPVAMPDTSELPAVVGLVRMTRASVTGPTTADVHPLEVSNYSEGGWVIAGSQ